MSEGETPVASQDHTPQSADYKPSRTIWIPQGFDPRDHVPAGLWKDANNIRLLMYMVIKGDMSRRREGWVPLHHENMGTLFGTEKKWWKLRDGCVDAGFLECNRYAEIGKRSFWYRLTPEWDDRPTVRYVLTEPEMIRRFDKIEFRRRATEGWEPVHEHLWRCLHLAQIDEAAARRWTCRAGNRKQRRAAMLVDMINAREHQMKRDAHGRIHTTITRLPKKIRPSIRLAGMLTSEIDIRCCQPCLLGLHTLDCYLKVNHPEETTHQQTFINPQKEEEGDEREKGINSIMEVEDASIHEKIPCDLTNYINVCSGGTFYEEFAETIKVACGTVAERNRVKRTACCLIFGEPRPHQAKWKRFEKRWPTVAECLMALKEMDYKNVAHVLQGFESRLIIREVCGLMMERYSDVPVVTIHDAIMTVNDAVPVVCDLINQVWGKEGMCPQLKVTG